MYKARKWFVSAAVLAASGLSVLGLAGGPQAGNGVAQAAAPVMGPPVQAPSGGIPGKLEGRGAEVHAAPPLYTTGPSPLRPLTDPVFGPNARANTDTTPYAQQEPSIAVNPTNSLNVIASGKDERSAPSPNTATKEVWEYTSFDGGATWTNQHVPLVGPNSTQQSDPVNIFRDDGVAYACYLGYGNNAAPDTGIYVTRSTDGGMTWNQTVLAVPELVGNVSYSTDKQWIAVDNNPASPFYHNIYLSWTEFGGCNACIHFVRSTDGGATWSDRTQQLSSGGNQQFSMPTVLANGNVFVNWASGGTIYYRISTDGGVTFGAQTVAGTMNTNLAMSGRNWRISAIPVAAADRTTPGNIVITWNDGRNNGASGVDIYYIHSTNGGTMWSAPARLNDDPTGVVKHQAEPWVTTSPNGLFHALWYDEREDSTASIIFNIYYAQSTDSGATWSPNIRISDATTDLNIGIPQGPGWNGAAGDYINASATNDRFYGDWTDTRSGTNEDVYVARGVFGGSGTPTATATATLPAATSTVATPVRTNTPTFTSTPNPCPVQTVNVGISNFMFTPQSETISVGSTIHWTNNGGTHTTTSDTPGLWDSGTLPVGGTFDFTFNTLGTYTYHCMIHGGAMNGAITVLPPCSTATLTPTSTSTTVPSPTSTANCSSALTFMSGDVPRIIPDLAVATSTVVVSGVGNVISNIKIVGLDITHPRIGDLFINLTSPSGAVVILDARECNSGNSANIPGVTLDDAAAQGLGDVCPPAAGGTYRPTNLLSQFNGLNPNGTWRLMISDNASGSSGTLNGWGLNITTSCTTPTVGATITPTATGTVIVIEPTFTATRTRVASATSIIPTITITPPLSSATVTVGATGTTTAVASASTTVGATSSSTVAPTGTPTIGPQASSTTVPPTACPIQFQDVPPSTDPSSFYPYVRCLACKGILGGYPCGGVGEPCGSSGNPYFRPSSNITRGQIAKVVSNAAGFTESGGAQIYTDVASPSTSPFYDFINRLSRRGYMGGYPCGGAGEPCDAQNRPYFRPGANASRGQLSKIVANAAQVGGTPSGQTYEDVAPASTFYLYIEQLSARGVIGGYACGGPGEPCGNPSRPYFRPNTAVTRGQAAKIVSNTFFPSCVTPARR